MLFRNISNSKVHIDVARIFDNHNLSKQLSITSDIAATPGGSFKVPSFFFPFVIEQLEILLDNSIIQVSGIEPDDEWVYVNTTFLFPTLPGKNNFILKVEYYNLLNNFELVNFPGTISAFKHVYVDTGKNVLTASPSTFFTGSAIGITTVDAFAGTSQYILIKKSFVTNPAWTFPAPSFGKYAYLAAGGDTTEVCPQTGIIKIVGVIQDATSIYYTPDFAAPIKRS